MGRTLQSNLQRTVTHAIQARDPHTGNSPTFLTNDNPSAASSRWECLVQESRDSWLQLTNAQRPPIRWGCTHVWEFCILNKNKSFTNANKLSNSSLCSGSCPSARPALGSPPGDSKHPGGKLEDQYYEKPPPRLPLGTANMAGHFGARIRNEFWSILACRPSLLCQAAANASNSISRTP